MKRTPSSPVQPTARGLTYAFTPGAREHVRACHASPGAWSDRLWTLLVVGFPASFVGVGILAGESLAGAVRSGAPYLALWLGFFLMVPLVRHWNAKRHLRASPGPREVELAADALRVRGAAGETAVPWTEVESVAETREFFRFYVAERLPLYLPKRVVPPGDLSAIRAFLRERVPARPRLAGTEPPSLP